MPKFIKVDGIVLRLDQIVDIELDGRSLEGDKVIPCVTVFQAVPESDGASTYTSHRKFFGENAAALRLYFSAANPDVRDLFLDSEADEVIELREQTGLFLRLLFETCRPHITEGFADTIRDHLAEIGR